MTDFEYIYNAEVISVYDGDTVRLDIDLGFKTWMMNESCRLYGIDTPEIRGEERPQGLESRARLIELTLGRKVIINSFKDKRGKYGRWLVMLFSKDFEGPYTFEYSINAQLVSEGFAKEYMK